MKKVVPATTLIAALAIPVLSATASYASPGGGCDGLPANIHEDQHDYKAELDRDKDGIACEDHNGFSTTPAPEQPVTPQPWAWDNCAQAFAHGVSNIPAGTPGYGPHLDSDLDGIGCERNGDDSDGVVYPEPNITEPAPTTQIEQIPVGGADTGVTPSQEISPSTAVLGLSAAALMATGMGGLAVRRARKS